MEEQPIEVSRDEYVHITSVFSMRVFHRIDEETKFWIKPGTAGTTKRVNAVLAKMRK